MSERKVLNKYFPPDFDPSKVPRMRKSKDRQEQIRLMAPFSMRCNTCGEYIYAGKKFNGRKETVQGEVYYGIKIFRFYIKCPVCSSEITFKTDPKNADYTVEHGVSRNFEPWREGKEQDDDEKADPLAHMIEEEGLQDSDDDDEDPMKALERRQNEAKREMEIMDALQDIRTRNARIDRVDADAVLQRVSGRGAEKASEEERKAEDEDEALVRRYFGRDLAGEGSGGRSEAGTEPPGGGSDSALGSPGTANASSSGPSIRRAHNWKTGVEQEEEREPEVASLLSDKARDEIISAGSSTYGAKHALAMPSKQASATAGPSKRRKGTSAFGIVRKKT